MNEKRLVQTLTPMGTMKRGGQTETLFLPNHSGDHSQGIVNTTPTQDTDIPNKAYVDSLQVPIGTILPWHKSATGCPSLPINSDWVECNGSAYPGGGTLTGNTPDLRSKFIRGNTTSGSTGGTDTHNHGGSTGQPSATVSVSTVGTTQAGNDRHVHNIISSNNIPAYVEMVFIIKYK